MKELSIIIVDYKSHELIGKIRQRLKLKPSWELIVIDNSENNRGFARACNESAKNAMGKWLLFLNPDCEADQSEISKMVQKISRDNSIGIIGPQLLDKEGQPYLSYVRPLTKRNAWIVLSFMDKLWSGNRFSKAYWYRDEDLEMEKQVGSVSGAALMIGRQDFEALSGFDEKMFMYWEDADLCRRMLKMGKKVIFYPKAKITHYRSGCTTPDSWEIRAWFRASRYRFMQKHFGWWFGTLLESSLLITEEWRFVLILVIAGYLRFYKLAELTPLIFDQGRDMLAALNGLADRQLPLLGIPSSIPRFRQGPVYVWILMVLFSLIGPDPYYAAITAAVIGFITVGGVYLVAERWWGRQAASMAAIILAAASLAVTQSRLAFHTNPIPLISLGLLCLLAKRLDKSWQWLSLGWWFGCLFQFELAVLPLILLVIWKIIRSSTVRWKASIWTFAGVLIALWPQVWWDVTHYGQQLGMFGIWVGYRILSFIGFDSEHVVSVKKVAGFSGSIWEYGQKFASPQANWWLAIQAGLILIGGIWVMNRRKTIRDQKILWLYSWIALIMWAYLIHGKPSEAYFPVLFIPWVLAIGYVGSHLRQLWRRALWLSLVIVTIVNVRFLINTDMMMNTDKSAEYGLSSGYGLPVPKQLEVVNLIISKVGVQQINLSAHGPGSEFESYLDNFKFLLVTHGAKLSDRGRKVVLLFGAEGKQVTILNSTRYQVNGIDVAIEQ